MKSHRIIIYLGVLLTALLALPGSALASSLLSGYGGPGQGNQAILGSALLNGPKGGGGSGGSSGSGGGSASASESSGAQSESSTSSSESSTRGSSATSQGASGSSPSGSGSGSTRHGGASGGRTTPAAATPASYYPVAERLPSGAQEGAFGLSGSDVLYIVLAVGVLVSLGVVTRRMGLAAEREGHGG